MNLFDPIVDFKLRLTRLAIRPHVGSRCAICESPMPAEEYVSVLALYAAHELLATACERCAAQYGEGTQR